MRKENIEKFFAQIKRHEGLYLTPYVCPAGKCTIGYGTNLEAFPEYFEHYPDIYAAFKQGSLRGKALCDALRKAGMRWKQENAYAVMYEEVMSVERSLNKSCPAFNLLKERMDQVRCLVLINMAFNMGSTGLLKFKNMLAAIETCNYPLAASEMSNSLWAKQVKGRAVELAEQMRSGVMA